MTNVLAFPSPPRTIDNADPSPQFHCTQEVVAHCLRKIGVYPLEGLVQQFVDELEARRYVVLPDWVVGKPMGPVA